MRIKLQNKKLLVDKIFIKPLFKNRKIYPKYLDNFDNKYFI